MRAILVALVVSVLCLSHSAKAEEVLGPDAVADAVAADVSPVEASARAEEAKTEALAAALVKLLPPPGEPQLAPGQFVLDIPFYWEKLCDALVSLLGIGWKALFSIGGIWLLSKIVGKERAALVKAAIGTSVDYTWDDMGRELKHAAKDRKLDADERQKLRNKCGTHTLTILKGAAKALFESYSVSTVNAMISAAVEKRKAIASVGKTNAVSAPAA